MPVRFKYGSESGDYVEVKVTEVLKTTGFNKKIMGIPGYSQVVINLGKLGPDLTVEFSLRSTTDYDQFPNITGGTIIQVLSGTGYTYKELPASSRSWVDKAESKRNKGYVDQWDCTLYITSEGYLIYPHPW